MTPTALPSLRVIPALGVVAFLTAATLAAAEQPERRPTPTPRKNIMQRGEKALEHEMKRYARDLRSIALAPARWDEHQWRQAGLLSAGVLSAFANDEAIARSFQRNRSHRTDEVSRLVTPLGGGAGLDLSMALLVGGLLSGNHALRDTGRDAIESSILAAGVVTPLLKNAFGRSRPNAGKGGYDFHPFSHNKSFPSGHATNAFAIASAISGHSSGWVMPAVAYSVATGVALSRMNDNVHFASDVVAGAIVGTAIGRSITSRHRQSTKDVWVVSPFVTGDGFGITVAVPFETIASRIRWSRSRYRHASFVQAE